jgi:protein-S-isoprenylcysteine O-methyltransferase Ste14
VPALDRRFGWSRVPLVLVIGGNVLFAVGYYLIYRVFRENSFTSATIEVAADQHVIDTGPYALVRHPMYGSALLYLLGTPLALSSYWGLVPFVVVIPFLIWRLFDEEKMLSRELKGYTEYMKRVPNRLIPGFW